MNQDYHENRDNKEPDKDGVAKDPAERLQEAIDGLRKGVTKVEVWAAALSAFSRPIPDYRPHPKYELGQQVQTPDFSDSNSESDPGTAPRKRLRNDF
ncbi:hypothetical protein [Pseudorhodoplanes sp.]|uniref:hypothetical protein n=1 Tax=Pseudorhodoplanes sp. TaxID=1934341 RepID=UPI0039189A15